MKRTTIKVILAAVLSCNHIIVSAKIDSINHPNLNLLPHHDTCGKVTVHPQALEDRIIGGSDAAAGTIPWIVHLPNGCGGSIINDRYVLTAAHCCRVQRRSVWVTCGETRNVFNRNKHSVNIEEIRSNEGFDPDHYKDDICLFRLSGKLNFTDYIKPICLPIYEQQKQRNLEGEYMEIAGWGVNYKDTDKLQTTPVQILDDKKCSSLYPEYKVEWNVCVGGQISRVTRAACGGDSGGPLMKLEEVDGSGNYYLYGLTSYGIDHECVEGGPVVYVKTTHYLNWILDNIKP